MGRKRERTQHTQERRPPQAFGPQFCKTGGGGGGGRVRNQFSAYFYVFVSFAFLLCSGFPSSKKGSQQKQLYFLGRSPSFCSPFFPPSRLPTMNFSPIIARAVHPAPRYSTTPYPLPYYYYHTRSPLHCQRLRRS